MKIRNKILSIACVVVFAVVAAFNINASIINNKIDVTLTNTEALGQTEIVDEICAHITYYQWCWKFPDGMIILGIRRDLN